LLFGPYKAVAALRGDCRFDVSGQICEVVRISVFMDLLTVLRDKKRWMKLAIEPSEEGFSMGCETQTEVQFGAKCISMFDCAG